jgi:hypothetical protein
MILVDTDVMIEEHYRVIDGLQTVQPYDRAG